MTDDTFPEDGLPEDNGTDHARIDDTLPEDLPPHLEAVVAPRRKLRGVRFLLMLVVVVAVVAAAGYGLLQTSAFAVGSVKVSGNSHVSKDEVLKLAAVDVGEPMISVRAGTVRSRLQANPWIASVDVHQSWPDTLSLVVHERMPWALVATTDQRWAQVGEDGAVLEVDDTAEPGLPVLVDETVEPRTGARATTEAARLVKLIGQLPDSLRPKVVQLQFTEASEFRLGLSTGPVVELGGEDQLGDKLMAAAAVIAKTDNATIGALDVRSPRLPVSVPKGGTTTTMATPPASGTTTDAG